MLESLSFLSAIVLKDIIIISSYYPIIPISELRVSLYEFSNGWSKEKVWLFLFEGNAKGFAFSNDGYHWCIKLYLAFSVLKPYFGLQRKAIFKSKVKNTCTLIDMCCD